MSKRYAEGTKVAAEKTQGEIMKLIKSRNPEQTMQIETREEWGYVWFDGSISYKIGMKLPTKEDFSELQVKANATVMRPASDDQKAAAAIQETARRLRCLLVYVKAKFIAVDEGIVDMETAFLSEVVTGPKGETFADQVAPQIRQAKANGLPMSIKALGGR